MSRSLNKSQIIGNLTADPEMRTTTAGSAVCTFVIATNRSWTESSGEKKEDTQYHRIIAWQKLAELCSTLLHKGSRAFVEGRMETRSYEKDGIKRYSTEVVANDMIVLSPKEVKPAHTEEANIKEEFDL